MTTASHWPDAVAIPEIDADLERHLRIVEKELARLAGNRVAGMYQGHSREILDVTDFLPEDKDMPTVPWPDDSETSEDSWQARDDWYVWRNKWFEMLGRVAYIRKMMAKSALTVVPGKAPGGNVVALR